MPAVTADTLTLPRFEIPLAPLMPRGFHSAERKNKAALECAGPVEGGLQLVRCRNVADPLDEHQAIRNSAEPKGLV